MDKITQIEVVLNMINTLFGKAIYFKDIEVVDKLNMIRRNIYYTDNFDYNSILENLKDVDIKLKTYE